MADFYKIDPLVMIGIPTLMDRPGSWEWTEINYSLQFPLGASTTRKRVKGEEVADARNALAEESLRYNCDWLLFIADDVLPPPNIFQLLCRHKKKLVTGVYWTKSYPREPYLWNGLLEGPFLDWKYGEFFKIDWAGCDALLIHTDVLREIEPPWFSHDWTWSEDKPKIPLPTEDLYFYTKCRANGIDLWCDASVQCGHQDRTTQIIYGLDSTMPQHEEYKAIIEPAENQRKIADIGSGAWTPHFENAKVVRFDIRPETKPDILCDVRYIPEQSESYDVVYANHVLEHFFFWESKNIVAEWLRILKIGGEIHITAPNLEHAAREILKSANDPDYDASYAFGMIYGTREGIKVKSEEDNQIHKVGFTTNGLKRLFSQFNCLDNLKIEAKGFDNEASLTVTAQKVKSSKPFEILPVWEKTKPAKQKDTLPTDFAIEAINKGAMQKTTEIVKLVKLLQNRKLSTVVEIGTARGGMFWLFCQLAQDDAQLISIDLPGGDFGGGYSKEDIEVFEQFRKGNQTLTFIPKDSHKTTTRDYLKRAINGKKIDLLFIDGDHRYEGVKKDYEMYSPLIADDGLIVFHDIVEHIDIPECEVDRFWNEVKQDKKTQEITEKSGGPWGGLGVIFNNGRGNENLDTRNKRTQETSQGRVRKTRSSRAKQTIE